MSDEVKTMDALELMLPHERTGDEASVNYRAKHIRAFWREIVRLREILARREARLEIDHAYRGLEMERFEIPADERDSWPDKICCLEADMDGILDVFIARINGERDLASASVWVKLNYPEKAKGIRERKTLGLGEG